MASAERISGSRAFRDLWVAGTLGALFAALASNVPQFFGANHLPPGVSPLRLGVRYGYALWLLAYFFISNLNNRDEPDPRWQDLVFDVVQSLASLGALFWMGFAPPGYGYLLDDAHFSSALIAVNLAVAIICFAGLLLLGTAMKTRANVLTALGLIVALLVAVLAWLSVADDLLLTAAFGALVALTVLLGKYVGARKRGGVEATVKPVAQEPRAKGSREFWIALSTIAALVAALAAGWAAFETRRAAIETGKATRAGVWLQVLSEYAEPEMLNSMKALREWRERDHDKFADRFRVLLLKPGKTRAEATLARELDGHRRRVTSFFNKLRVLAEGGVIDEEFISATWSSGTYTYIVDVLMPMERAKEEAMFQAGSLTPDDKEVGESIQTRTMTFYRRIADRSKKTFLRRGLSLTTPCVPILAA